MSMPMSRPNLVVMSFLLVGIALTAALGQWQHTGMLTVLFLGGLVIVYAARRPNASAICRVNSIEYRDDRDRAIARYGFAVVGNVALALSYIEWLVAIVLYPELRWLPALQVVVLSGSWLIGNHIAARRL